MIKEELSAIFEEIAILLELNAENPFKIRAYNTAAHILANLDEDLKKLIEEKRLTELEGIGDTISAKIMEYVDTGKISYLEKMRTETPHGLIEMLAIAGLGPKKIHALYKTLGISSIGELEYACMENRLKDLVGFGLKTQEKILHGIEMMKANKGKYLYHHALRTAEAIQNDLLPFTKHIAITGSLRRFKEVVKDIDFVAVAKEREVLLNAFTTHSLVKEVIQKGENKASVKTIEGINADLLVVEEEEFPFALHHFTGSKEHNIAMRSLAKTKGLKINEYGVFKEEQRILAKNEEEFFGIFNLSYIPPEIREDTGEILAAQKDELPQLVEEADIQGIFHVHTTFSDGLATLREMRDAAKALGFKYLGISDHSQTAIYAGGLKVDDVMRQAEEIAILNAEDNGFMILKGIESDILPDGSLDYSEEILKHFDFVIGSVHSRFNMTEKDMTDRILKALQNKYLTILGHPTGRLLLAREAYPLEMEEVLKTAAAYGKCIEINSNPHRLDLDWHWCRRAKEMGIKIAINPDAHRTVEMSYFRFGVKVAKKAWLSKTDVLNAMPLQDILSYLQVV